MKQGITIESAIKKAIRFFEVQKAKGELDERAEIRSIYLQEGSGSGRLWTDLSIRIEYAIDGNYETSDKTPYVVNIEYVDEVTPCNVYRCEHYL